MENNEHKHNQPGMPTCIDCDDGLECKFLKSLDSLQQKYRETVQGANIANVLADQIAATDKDTGLNHERRLEDRLNLIIASLGLYIEHELDKCEYKQHQEVKECTI